MKAFTDLTRRGQARRLHRLALQALRLYELDVDRLNWVSRWTNDMLRVRTRDGNVYALRLCRPGWRTREDLLLEVAWLKALQGDADLNTPHIILSRDGAPFVEVDGEDGAEPRRCLLIRWSKGIRLGLRMTEANLHKMGYLFSQLHERGAAFVQPSDLPIKKMDGAYARGDEDILFAALHRAKVARRIIMLFERTTEQVAAAFAQRYADPTGLRVIHNDLHHENINFYRGCLYPFDFEDTIWGYPVQDIATALQDLMEDTPPDAFEPLQDAFRAGYERHSPWPERYPGEIDVFRAGFVLKRANNKARGGKETLRQYVGEIAPVLKAFLDTGQLRKR